MDRSGLVVLRYNTDKWHEAMASRDSDSASAGTSPSKLVTLNYRKDRSGTPTPRLLPVPWQVKSSREEPTKVVRKTTYDANEPFFTRPVAESLMRLRNFEENMRKLDSLPESTYPGPFEVDRRTLDKNWYHDATNVAQRLRLLRDTYKVLQAVRKKRAMGERVDFRTAHEIKSRSRTGSPAPSDDDAKASLSHLSGILASGDDKNAVPVVTAPKRGRPRKRGGVRGRKPGPRSRVGVVPGPVVTRRRGRSAAIASEAKSEAQTSEQASENTEAGGEAGRGTERETTEEAQIGGFDPGSNLGMDTSDLDRLVGSVVRDAARGPSEQENSDQGQPGPDFSSQPSFDTSVLTQLTGPTDSAGSASGPGSGPPLPWGNEIMVPELMPQNPVSQPLPPAQTGYESQPALAWSSQPQAQYQPWPQHPQPSHEELYGLRQDPGTGGPALSESTVSIIENLKRKNPTGSVLASLYGRPGGLSFSPQWQNNFFARDPAEAGDQSQGQAQGQGQGQEQGQSQGQMQSQSQGQMGEHENQNQQDMQQGGNRPWNEYQSWPQQ